MDVQLVVTEPHGVSFSFSDVAMDKTYGELFCTTLRRDMANVERASHVTDYDGFRIEVVKRGECSATPQQLLKDACTARVDEVTALLASLGEE